MNETNKFLTVAMGECWHYREYTGGGFVCRKCTTYDPDHNTNFSTPDGFFKLWNWAQTQEWWALFTLMDVDPDECHNYITLMSGTYFHTEAINPERFATAVYEFLKEQG